VAVAVDIGTAIFNISRVVKKFAFNIAKIPSREMAALLSKKVHFPATTCRQYRGLANLLSGYYARHVCGESALPIQS
jgi:hypothetical protein